MKKHIAKTITILSLFVTLSVSASNVSAGGGCSTCNPHAQYAVSGAAQTTSSASAQDAGPGPTQDSTAADAQPVGDASSIALLWTRLAVFFASLL